MKRKKLKIKSFPLGMLIGIRLVKLDRGTAICVMKAETKHLNPLGRVHGGVLCDLADAAMGYAFLSHLPAGRKGVALHFQISFMKGVRTGDRLTCTAKTVSHGRSLYFMESSIKNKSGRLIAKAASTCKTLPQNRD